MNPCKVCGRDTGGMPFHTCPGPATNSIGGTSLGTGGSIPNPGGTGEMPARCEHCGSYNIWATPARSDTTPQPPKDDGGAVQRAMSFAEVVRGLKPIDRYDTEVHLLALADEVKRLEAGMQAVVNLISESQGVYGLHLNGDVSPWDELRTGGRYEAWLLEFDAALAARKEP